MLPGPMGFGNGTLSLPSRTLRRVPALRACQRPPFHAQTPRRHDSSSSKALPRIVQPTIWRSIIPRFLRRDEAATRKKKLQTWNPASFFIIISILIGSQSIRIIGLRNEHDAYIRKMNAKLEVLKKVIEGIQRGEDIDVEKMLGTGDIQKEREWEDLIKELEAEDSLWHSRGNTVTEKSRKKNQSLESHEASTGPSNSDMKADKPPATFYT